MNTSKDNTSEICARVVGFFHAFLTSIRLSHAVTQTMGFKENKTEYLWSQRSEELFSGCLVCCDICQHAERLL